MAITRLLVANRGEIAVRVFRTCDRLDVETVAVAAPDDRGALHTRRAGATIEIPSYLDADALVAAARSAGADAVHPGYGFLAESAAFAEQVETAGLTWVGPPSAALRLGGDKLAARGVAQAAGLTVLPEGDFAVIGLPLIVKAAGGGGGRGMRVVTTRMSLEAELAAASREAEAAFGDSTVYCERYVPRGRHVEVQLVADVRGTVVALGNRDCSIQRRNQKLVEEAPAPNLTPELRDRLTADAIAFATALGYVGAGTVEFLVDGEDAYFLELNGRIQVEHPVTEAVTGLDIVELQLRVAAGEPLALDPPHAAGHAIEVRLVAEDPASFAPRSGTIELLRLPGDARVDAGIEVGDVVGTRYDSLLAKVVACGATREEARDRLAAALSSTEVAGVETNLPFLRWLVDHPAFRATRLSTAFLVDHPPLSPYPLREPDPAWLTPWRLNLPSPTPSPPPDIATVARSVDAAVSGELCSPMPGLVLDVLVRVGDVVDSRQPLVVIEAMKLEHPVAAPFAGTVAAVNVSAGDQVATGAVLVELRAS